MARLSELGLDFVAVMPASNVGPVQRFQGTAPEWGTVTLPAGSGEPHLLCAGSANPLAEYYVDHGAGGAWQVGQARCRQPRAKCSSTVGARVLRHGRARQRAPGDA